MICCARCREKIVPVFSEATHIAWSDTIRFPVCDKHAAEIRKMGRRLTKRVPGKIRVQKIPLDRDF